MYINPSEVSCGVFQLSYLGDRDTIKDANYYSDAAIVQLQPIKTLARRLYERIDCRVATLVWSDIKDVGNGAKLAKDFRLAGYTVLETKPMLNKNSGNRIVTYMCNIRKR